MRSFTFESYGVSVSIEASSEALLNFTLDIANRSLLGRLRESAATDKTRVVKVGRRSGSITLNFDGEGWGTADSDFAFANFFDTRLRLLIAEHAPDYVFIHAGVVAHRDRAILLPGTSHAGKSTLVYELVKRGALYMSDEYAVIDAGGLVHAFPRPISMRSRQDSAISWDVPVDTLRTDVPEAAVIPGLILFTGYRARARWLLETLSPAQGILELLAHSISIRSRPEKTLSVLNKVASRAIIAKSLRGDVKIASQRIIDFVDKSIF